MQTLSFQQNNRAPTERLIFQYHSSDESAGNVDHRNLCAAVRAWAADEGRLVVALQIKEAAEELALEGIDLNVQPGVWNVKMFRWLDNKENSAAYHSNVELLAPAIISALPLAYRDRVVRLDDVALRIAKTVKEDAEAIQAVMLKAPKQVRLKEISEKIVASFYLDGPDSVAPLMAMVTTMLGGAL